MSTRIALIDADTIIYTCAWGTEFETTDPTWSLVDKDLAAQKMRADLFGNTPHDAHRQYNLCAIPAHVEPTPITKIGVIINIDQNNQVQTDLLPFI